MDYLVYAHLQLGQDAKASAVVHDMQTIAGFSETFIAGPYGLAASPARYAVERGDWKSAAALEVRPNPLLHAQAVTYFAKALRHGCGKRGNLEACRAARLGAREKRCVLGRASRHPAAGRNRLDVQCGQAGRSAHDVERGGRRRRSGQIMKHQHPHYEDPVVSYMKRHNIPVTRERYIDVVANDDEKWGLNLSIPFRNIQNYSKLKGE